MIVVKSMVSMFFIIIILYQLFLLSSYSSINNSLCIIGIMGKSSMMGKSTISMATFNSKLLNYQRVYPSISQYYPIILP